MLAGAKKVGALPATAGSAMGSWGAQGNFDGFNLRVNT